MRFNLGEVWESVDKNGVSRRAVVVAIDDERRRGRLYFDDTGDEEWFLWAQLTQAGNWQVDTSPRPSRSADELKATILQKIKSHPVCPDGIKRLLTFLVVASLLLVNTIAESSELPKGLYGAWLSKDTRLDILGDRIRWRQADESDVPSTCFVKSIQQGSGNTLIAVTDCSAGGIDEHGKQEFTRQILSITPLASSLHVITKTKHIVTGKWVERDEGVFIRHPFPDRLSKCV